MASDNAPPSSQVLRVFFAVWPPAQCRDALALLAGRVVERTGGRKPASTAMHLTLAFIGDASADERARLVEAATPVARCATAFDVTLDRLGAFRKAGVAWLGCSLVPEGLAMLVEALRAALEGAGFAPERRPFTPHLTLGRRTRRTAVPELAFAPMTWRVDAMTLTASTLGSDGSSYRDLARLPFGA